MLFNSLSFLFFLPLVFVLYWFVAKGNLKRQNLVLLAASYFFYGCWDVRFLSLLIFSTLLDYFTGLQLYRASNLTVKRRWLWLSVAANLGFLAAFKYFNFFTASFSDAAALLGVQLQPATLHIILPVGISFYTFHGLSYVFDLYYGKIAPERDWIRYSLFVSFFPLLVAGPIERATHLLPQLKQPRIFSYHKAADGLRQMLWGFFKKVVIADNCAAVANPIFEHSASYPGSALALGAVFFAIQIYCDFSGYADIALGTARLLGIELLRNFAYPYFSRNIAEFWRRWHISLSSWFREYVYIPLGGSRGSRISTVRNVLIIFLISGFWHGANWTFMVWGLLHAIYMLPSILLNTNRTYLDVIAKDRMLPRIQEFAGMVLTFALTVFAWIFFRAASLHAAWLYVSGLFSHSLFTFPHGMNVRRELLWLIPGCFMVEWWGRCHPYALAMVGDKWYKPARWALYYALLWAILSLNGDDQQFIYFQF